MEEPQDFIRTNFSLLPVHIDYLKKIDGNNLSGACRIALDKLINQTKREVMDRYLLLFAVGILFIIFSFSLYYNNIFLLVGITVVGLFFVTYAAISALVWGVRK